MILNIGSLNIDHVYQVDTLVRPGETVTSSRYTKGAGGKGLNQSIAAARAGAEVAHAGCIGEDGESLRQTLQHAGVDVTRIDQVTSPTGHAIIQIDREGRNCIVVYSGANHGLQPETVTGWLDGLGPKDTLLLQHEVNEPERWVRLGREKGMRVLLNPAPAAGCVPRSTLEALDALIVNEVEAAELSRTSMPHEALDRLTAWAPKADIIVTLGAAGCIWGRGNQRSTHYAPKVKAIDTTAAGDTFVGYWVAATAMGHTNAAAIEWAIQAAALCVQRVGAAAAIPAIPAPTP
ncbi:MAG: ribokinase [Planctomycetota bacterium]